MASQSLGTLTLDLIAKIGGFTEGLDKAGRDAAKQSKAIQKSLNEISTASIAVGNALGDYLKQGIDAVAQAFPRLIEGAAKFQDLAEETGGSAQGLASLAVGAATAGVSMESVAAASVKLTKGLTGVDDESKAAGAALAALNIPLEEFKALSPEERIDKLTQAFSNFADGTEKTAVAVALFGKTGAEQLKLFKALEEQGGRSNILTAEQIKLADDYADRQAKTRAELSLYASALATQVIPTITDLTKVLSEVAKEILNVSNESTKLGQNTAVQTFAEDAADVFAFIVDAGDGVVRTFQTVGKTIAAAAAGAAAVARGDLRGALSVGDSFNEDLDKTLGKSQFSERLKKAREDRKALDALSRQENRGFTPNKQKLDFSGALKKASGSGDDPAKKALENFLKDQEAAVKEEQELLKFRNKVIDDANSDNLVSVKDYFEQRYKNQDEALIKELTLYEKEIAALEKFRDAQPKSKDREEIQGKINALLEKEASLVRDVGQANYELNRAQNKATKEYQDSLKELNAQILEMQGNLGAAAAIKFDQSNESRFKIFTKEGNQDALKALDTLKQHTVAQAELNKIQQQFSLAQGDLSIAEERITIARDRGTMGELESLRASGEARKRAVAVMQDQLAALESINKAALQPEQVQAIERLKVQLEGLQATIDPVADKFNNLFADQAGGAFADFINGTKTASQAFKSFANSVTSEIVTMLAKDQAKKLFSGGGIGEFFSKGLDRKAAGASGDGPLAKLFGGTAPTASLGALSTATSATSAVMATLTASASAAAAALASVAGSSAASSLSGLGSLGSGGGGGDFGTGSAFGNMDFGGFFASGGSLRAGQFGIAGERGPELIVGPATIVPQNGGVNGRSGGATINLQVMPGASRETAYQAGRTAARELARVNGR